MNRNTEMAGNDDHSFVCPHCGADVAGGATFCRECGAEGESGWGDERWDESPEGYGGQDDFDYQEYLKHEFPESAARGHRRPVLAVMLVVLLCLALLLLTISRF